MSRRAVLALAAAGWLALIAAATPPPAALPPGAPPAVGRPLTPDEMKKLLPKVPLHSEYLVDVNKLGQVTGAKASKLSKNNTFNLQTYGNALQAFIRTADGKAESGVYRLIYDYNPASEKIHRDVALVHLGGTDPNARGAALIMMERAQKASEAAAAKAKLKAVPVPHIAVSPRPTK